VLILVSRVRGHLQTHFRFVTAEKFVVIRTSFGASWHATEAPSIQLPGETRKLTGFEILGQNLSGERFLLVDDKAIPVG